MTSKVGLVWGPDLRLKTCKAPVKNKHHATSMKKVYQDDGLLPDGTLWTKDVLEGVCMLFVALATLVSIFFNECVDVHLGWPTLGSLPKLGRFGRHLMASTG